MTDRAPSDEDFKKFNDWYKQGAPRQGATPNADPVSKPSVFQPAINAAGSFIGGIGKEISQMPAPPGGINLERADPKGPVSKWAATEDPDHPNFEKAGRITADVAPYALPMDLPIAGAALKVAPRAIRTAVAADRLGNATIQGTIGGAMQPTSDRGRAAETGAGTGVATRGATMAAEAAWKAMPPNVRWAISIGGPTLGVLAAQMLGHDRSFWEWYHASQAALPVAAGTIAAGARFPGAAGAIGARAEDWANPEQPQQ